MKTASQLSREWVRDVVTGNLRKKKVSEMSGEERDKIKAKWREEARSKRERRKEEERSSEPQKVKRSRKAVGEMTEEEQGRIRAKWRQENKIKYGMISDKQREKNRLRMRERRKKLALEEGHQRRKDKMTPEEYQSFRDRENETRRRRRQTLKATDATDGNRGSEIITATMGETTITPQVKPVQIVGRKGRNIEILKTCQDNGKYSEAKKRIPSTSTGKSSELTCGGGQLEKLKAKSKLNSKRKIRMRTQQILFLNWHTRIRNLHEPKLARNCIKRAKIILRKRLRNCEKSLGKTEIETELSICGVVDINSENSSRNINLLSKPPPSTHRRVGAIPLSVIVPAPPLQQMEPILSSVIVPIPEQAETLSSVSPVEQTNSIPASVILPLPSSTDVNLGTLEVIISSSVPSFEQNIAVTSMPQEGQLVVVCQSVDVALDYGQMNQDSFSTPNSPRIFASPALSPPTMQAFSNKTKTARGSGWRLKRNGTGVPRGTLKHHGADEIIICPICGNKYKKSYINYHKQRLHNPNFKNGKCVLCGLSFRRAGDWYYHYSHDHVGNPKRPFVHPGMGKSRKVTREQEKRTEPESYKSKAKLKSNQKDRPFACNKCGTSFQKKFQLNDHEFYVHGEGLKKENWVKCPLCDISLKRKGLLKLHIKTVHNGVKTGTVDRNCGKCGEVFSYLRELKEHVECFHLDSYFPCNYCQVIKFNNDAWKFHTIRCRKIPKEELSQLRKQWKDNGETDGLQNTPIQCEFCPRKVLLQSLRRHYVEVHKLEREDNFTCRLCGNDFRSRQLFAYHMVQSHKIAVEECLETCRRYNKRNKDRMDGFGNIEEKSKVKVVK